MRRLEGKVAVVTGGSSGMGRATAKQFVAEGATVIITGRRRDRLDEAVAEISAVASTASSATLPTAPTSNGCETTLLKFMGGST